MKITAITCTYQRPAAFKLCEKYMDRQTRKPDQWLVLDSPEPMINKLLSAIEGGQIEGDGIVFFEDDDWYCSTWNNFCEQALSKFELIGEGLAIYYNVRNRWWSQCGNNSHASLCQTAIRKSLLGTLCDVIRTHQSPWVDTQLWKIECNKMLYCPKTPAERRLVGIKGMPGTAGYSREHRKFDPKGCNRDQSGRKLFELLGQDAAEYMEFYDNSKR